jgi:hypothetical protein
MYVANRMLSAFMNRPVVIDTPLDSIAGVLLAADCRSHGLGTFFLGVPGRLQLIIRTWTVIKLARSHT